MTTILDFARRRRDFLILRSLTLLWGFGVSLVFTGELITSVAMWTVVVIGNTVIMWRYAR